MKLWIVGLALCLAALVYGQNNAANKLNLTSSSTRKLFNETTYKGIWNEDNTIQMINEIETNKQCAGYEFVVDDGSDYSADCVSNKIEITHKKSDVHRDGHLTLTLYANLISDPTILDFTKIILELPVTKVEKLFKETSYEGTLKEDNSVQMIDEIETYELCSGCQFEVGDGSDFGANCVNDKITITHINNDVHRDGHLTLTLRAKLISDPTILDFTKIILELPVTKVEKLFKETSYEGILKEDNSIHIKDDKIELNKPCAGYVFVVDGGNDFSAVCDDAKIKITLKNPDVPRDGHLTLILYAKSNSTSATMDTTVLILELTYKDGSSSCSNDIGLIVSVALLSVILVGVLIGNAVFYCQNKKRTTNKNSLLKYYINS